MEYVIFWKNFQIVELRMSNAYSRDFNQKLYNVYQVYSRKISKLWNFEYPMHIPEILY